MKIVTCNGCFDGLHPGHLFFLGYAKAQGDKLVVGINSDEYISQNKRKQPLFDQETRKNVLLALGVVDEVHIFYEDNPIEFIRSVQPQVHCTGEEYRGKAVEMTIVRQIGAEMCWVPRTKIWSTSQLTEMGFEWVKAFMDGKKEGTHS